MRYGQRSGPPSWFVILLGIAIVFGIYYLWVGLRNFMASGASVVESTRQAIVQDTATAVRIHELEVSAPTPLPSFTPVPPCQEFGVIVREAIVRAEPSTNSRIVDALKEGETVCVITKLPDSDWYLIDRNALTRRIDRVFMHQAIVRALHPTETPTVTLTPTPTPTATKMIVRTARPTKGPSRPTVDLSRPSPTPSDTPTALPASIHL